MKDRFFAVAYHGTKKSFVGSILTKINFQHNVGDKFLGQGFYLWRDSYERALVWKGVSSYPIEKEEKAVIYAKIEEQKNKTLNFTSYNWNQEKDLLRIYNDYFSEDIFFGEFIDMLIAKGLEINVVIIADLRKEPNIIKIDDMHFAYTDIQICLKNDKPIVELLEVK
ncbi:hypothetical protein N5T63_07615 [Aliarcobacter cryaerophilus]|jgi:hypothetical protein|uniref:hypothetical protein n=1 Tax=Aliarcobacter cryaerophilus TaxID=28198 RepID=UPI0021B6C09E|nr:hypothetical protein [Aliarcobacter cryaerophilus]MCT7488763.1 hypothetical protein [Aliarcobacter cryaerophilus]